MARQGKPKAIDANEKTTNTVTDAVVLDKKQGDKSGDSGAAGDAAKQGAANMPGDTGAAVVNTELVADTKEETPAPGFMVASELAKIPLPTAEYNEAMAQALADNPVWLDIVKTTYERSLEIIADRNKPAPLSVDELAAAAHQRLVKRYGKDYVTAKRPNGNQIYFNRIAWNKMGANKNGWVEQTKTMPEVQQ